VDETSGLVWAYLNGPHSGWPNAPQPCGFLLRSRMSFRPIGLSGQPIACAIGLHMARTTGLRRRGSDSPGPEPASSWSASKLRTDFQRELDGDHTMGWRVLAT